jgi:hypothetical protein
MAAPSFVNAAAMSGTAADTHLSVNLPGSRVNGNLLVCVLNFGISDRTAVFPSPWVVIANTHAASAGSSVVAYRYVDGTETAPNVTWTGLANCDGRIYQYSGTLGSSPIGAHHETISSSSGNTGSDSGVTVTSNNSRVVLYLSGGIGNETVASGPGGSWTQDSAFTTASIGGVGAWSETTPSTVGSASDSSSFTLNVGANSRYSVFTIELLSEVAPTEVDITAAPSMGFSEAATISNTAVLSAAPSIGFSEAALVSLENIIPPDINTGFSVAATVTPERDLTAAPSLGFGANREPLKYRRQQPVVCITN